MRKYFLTLLLLCGTVALVCCGEDCPNCPTPPKDAEYYLTVSYGIVQPFAQYTYRYSLKTLEVVDSLYWAEQPPVTFRLTPDARYLIFQGRNPLGIVVTDFDSHDTLAMREMRPDGGISLSPSGQLLAVGSDQGLTLLTVPDLSVEFQNNIPCRQVTFGSDGTEIFTGAGTSIDVYQFVDDWTIVRSIPVPRVDGAVVQLAGFLLSRDGSEIYAVVLPAPQVFYFLVFSAQTGAPLFERYIPYRFFISRPQVGNRLYLGYYGPDDFPSDLGTLFEYDVGSRSMEVILTAADFDSITFPIPYPEFAPTGLMFLPNSEIGLIANDQTPFGKPSGPIIVYDFAQMKRVGNLNFRYLAAHSFIIDPRPKNK